MWFMNRCGANPSIRWSCSLQLHRKNRSKIFLLLALVFIPYKTIEIKCLFTSIGLEEGDCRLIKFSSNRKQSDPPNSTLVA